MPREKFHTLTEQMFYVLLCLRKECYGMDILDQVPAMTRETKVEGRRRSYLLTDKGQEALAREYQRICAQAEDYRRALGEEEEP